MKDEKYDDGERPRKPGMGRRDLMKLGAGVVATALTASKALAQRGGGPGETPQAGPDGVSYQLPVRTRAGYVYMAERESNNGPMDDTSRTIVTWANGLTYAKLTAPEKEMLNRIMLDYMAATVSGFEEPSVRLAAQCAAQVAPRKLGATVMGYGISSSIELATFANSAMGRHTDFNDLGPGGHTSDFIPSCFAVGEAMHATGEEFLAAIAVGYELAAAGIGGGGESAHTAVAAGKLFKLNDDRLANALTIGMTPHVTLNKGVGAMSMWKGLRSAEPVKCGVWGAVMAHEGVTGPPQPYEGRGGVWSRSGRREIKLPMDPKALALMRMGFKRYPAEGSSQSTLDNIPDMRAFAKVDEIARIDHWLGGLGEIADNPKWDPHNRETADHSMPYILARAMIDGEIYLGSFTEAKFRDPQALELMKKITMSQGVGFGGNGAALTVITKKNGEKKEFPAQGGRRRAPEGELLSKPTSDHRLTMDEIVAKFNRACEYKKVDTAQRDKARALFSNMAALKDVGEAIQSLAKFGQPKPLV